MDLKVVTFDADDTLWHNELYYKEAEDKFCGLLDEFMPAHAISRELLKTEIQNISLYGYGIKSFMLSMIETALRISEGNIPPIVIDKILGYGKEMLEKPVDLIEGVEQVLESLFGKYRLVMATKGDLLDQERKLRLSGLGKYFHHIEIMSEKKVPDYEKLTRHLDIEASQFMMIGNSLKSDVLPVLDIGGYAIHVPHHITWEHEHIDASIDHPNFYKSETILGVLEVI